MTRSSSCHLAIDFDDVALGTWTKLMQYLSGHMKELQECERLYDEGEDLKVVADRLILTLARAQTAVLAVDHREQRV